MDQLADLTRKPNVYHNVTLPWSPRRPAQDVPGCHLASPEFRTPRPGTLTLRFGPSTLGFSICSGFLAPAVMLKLAGDHTTHVLRSSCANGDYFCVLFLPASSRSPACDSQASARCGWRPPRVQYVGQNNSCARTQPTAAAVLAVRRQVKGASKSHLLRHSESRRRELPPRAAIPRSLRVSTARGRAARVRASCPRPGKLTECQNLRTQGRHRRA